MSSNRIIDVFFSVGTIFMKITSTNLYQKYVV